jgi:indolepyruvate ferredoxin oxidoreductase
VTALDHYSLADRYTRDAGRIFVTGVQALARVPIEVLRADRAEGRTTAAFLSGYQGSPLGGFDQEMARAAALVPELPIVLRPAVNEELAATAVMGSQLTANQPDQRYDGVVGFWYGKAPGLDRAADALRHACFAGSSAGGGAVALVGDDPASKSSTLPTSSDVVLVGLLMPVFYPGDVQDILDLGRHAVAMSRITGLWTSIKVVTAVADGTGTVDLDPSRTTVVVPDREVGGRLFVPHPNARLLPPVTLERERELKDVRLELARRYGAANQLNYCPVNPPGAWIGIAATGYTYHETLQALRRLGLDSEAAIASAGIRLLNLRLPFPLDPATIRNFAVGLDEIVIVEEKGPTLERLMKDVLYGTANAPRIVGKLDDVGNTLMVDYGMLDADKIIEGLRRRLSPRLNDRLAPAPAPARERTMIPLSTTRKPYFCSGCPHNWGTKVPEGSLVGAGIGCHGMTLLMDEDKVGDIAGITAMGGEGAQWIGMSPFLDRPHFIQNLGDGTFFHSGQLAVQASVAAGVNVTYKLLYNGTVAMTGGQDATGAVGVPEIATILLSHGVTRVLITTDDLNRYKGVALPTGPNGSTVDVWDRRRIVEAQELLAGVPGTTVLIHDQACAAQARRLRKRGKATRPTFRVAINHRICEACGDCGEVSNCLSVQSIDTPLGLKTTIDQTTCNQDFSCLDGDCPSFMTIDTEQVSARSGGVLGRARTGLALVKGVVGTRSADAGQEVLPPPQLVVPAEVMAIRMAGIGGTGVVTVAQVVGTAAMIDGWDVRGLDQTGLSQKAGPVVSDLRLSRQGASVSNLIGTGEADCVLAFDLLVAVSEAGLTAASADRTVFVASTTVTPTGEMIGHPDLIYPGDELLSARADGSSRAPLNRYVDAGAITGGLQGDASTANIFLLGVAVQAGCIPIGPEALERAIDLNGVAVEANLASFRWGRRWVVDPAAVQAEAGLGHRADRSGHQGAHLHVEPLATELAKRISDLGLPSETAELVQLLTADLVGYQNERYANRYLDDLQVVVQAEARVRPGATALTTAAARGLHKLMAYKDEYEVARLLVGPEGVAAAESVGGPGARVSWRLHPPMLRALGLSHKLSLPATWARPAMVALAAGKRLRGTALDPFGRAEVRRVERALVADYGAALRYVAANLGATSYDDAVSVAGLADQVRGYEHIKLERAVPVRERLQAVVAGR